MDTAQGIHLDPDFKLGSIVGSGKQDKRTLMLSDFVDTEIQIPSSWDFDKHRSPFPLPMWGNDEYGDCELAARANLLLRLQRIQTHRTPKIDDTDVVNLYKLMTGCQSPGDAGDTGLTTLDNLNQWRNGWQLTKEWHEGHGLEEHIFRIAAYGMIDLSNLNLVKLSSYLFSGAILGCNMPLTARRQTQQGLPWDVVSSGGAEAIPGSWGGHAVLTKKYDADNFYVLTWGREIQVTSAWMREYTEEAYSVVDDLDSWVKHSHMLDIVSLINKMKENGITVYQ